MKNYLDSDLDVHAIVILTDGFNWELWVRPKGMSVTDLDNPHVKASLRDSLKTVRSRNKISEPYRPHQVRENIDIEAFSKFTVGAVLDVVREDFKVPTSS